MNENNIKDITYYKVEKRTKYRHFPEQDCWDTDYTTNNITDAWDVALEENHKKETMRIVKVTEKTVCFISENGCVVARVVEE